eukprot:m.1170845 g.1170845  ORF g.1170845 m.1170845 type:complete len:98 (+) comp24510_c0_seq34:6675-6968(+)
MNSCKSSCTVATVASNAEVMESKLNESQPHPLDDILVLTGFTLLDHKTRSSYSTNAYKRHLVRPRSFESMRVPKGFVSTAGSSWLSEHVTRDEMTVL